MMLTEQATKDGSGKEECHLKHATGIGAVWVVTFHQRQEQGHIKLKQDVKETQHVCFLILPLNLLFFGFKL